MKFFKTPVLIFVFLLFVTSCGGNDESDNVVIKPVSAASLNLSFEQTKLFQFTWTDVSDATFYRLLENSNGSSGFTQTASDIPQGTQSLDIYTSLYNKISAQYILQSCNIAGCIDSSIISVSGNLASAIGYFKASNVSIDGIGDYFGYSVFLSGDGYTLAVGAIVEDSSATGVNGDENNNDAPGSGAVYVFSRNENIWAQQAYLKASNTDPDDSFGLFVSLSDDGNTLAVVAGGESSSATGVNGDENNNDAPGSGAVYVFSRNENIWTQQAYLKASNTDPEDGFGSSVFLSGDGNDLVVGAYKEDSSAIGVNGDENNNNALNSGAAYIFSRTDTAWVQQAYLKASNTDSSDLFGLSVTMNSDGSKVAVGSVFESGIATGVNGDENNNDAPSSGAVYVFSRTDNIWTRQAYLKASNANSYDNFGWSISLSDDGSTLAVGAPGEASSATGVNGDEINNDKSNSGAVYVFNSTDNIWSQQTYLKASNSGAADGFGNSVTLSNDGNMLAVGAPAEDSFALGINGNENDDSLSVANSGAVYVFNRIDLNWHQQAYLKASNSAKAFGSAVSLSGDGTSLAAGSSTESSSATGINGDQTNGEAPEAGAVYLY